MVLRPLVPLVLSLGALSLAACGSDVASPPTGNTASAPSSAPAATYGLPEAERALRDGGLDLLRHGNGSALQEGLEPEPRTSETYTVQDNSQLDLLVFPTPQDAERAAPTVDGEKIVKQGGQSARAGNLILVVSGGLDDRASYKAAFDAFGKLADRAQ